MAAIVAVVWYCLLTVGRNSSHVDGTFVRNLEIREEMENGSMTQTVYVKLSQITQVHKKDVFLSDIADVYCSDKSTASRCKAVKVQTIHSDQEKRYMGSIVDVVQKISENVPEAEVNSVGETDFIIDYQPSKKPMYTWQWLKTIFVCLVCFSGAAFAIMTFNNDASVLDVFKELYRLIMGQESDGLTILETSYSVGLALGIIVFFNHFAKLKLNTDPTPLEVECVYMKIISIKP